MSTPEIHAKRPPWGELSAGDKALAIVLVARATFMVSKGIWFVVKFVNVGLLYKKTYKVWCQFEVLFFLGSAFKVLILMPDVFLYEINWLFYGLALNSALAYTLSYELRQRTFKVLGITDSKWATIWYGARMTFLIFIMITPFINFIDPDTKHYLTCEYVLYRKFNLL
jgi:hypothetical protein